MILDTLDFEPFFKEITPIFEKHFSEDEVDQIMGYVDILSDANFRCYRANMMVIEERKKSTIDVNLISEMEWVARSVGEYRVSSKARINRLISKLKSIKEVVPPDKVRSDDIVYSIGEMMDRLSIETIKRVDFMVNNRDKSMTDNSLLLSNRVKKYLIDKLEEIDEKGFYECVHEQRTYEIDDIKKDLAI